MQIDQIVIRPDQRLAVVSVVNALGQPDAVTVLFTELDSPSAAGLKALIVGLNTKLPSDPPASVLQEIANLESQLATLRKTAGLD